MNLSLIFSCVSLTIVSLLFFYPALASLPVLITLFFFLGLPHGALDIVVGKELLSSSLGKNWWIPFTVAYLLLSLSMIALWTLWPFLGFILFLIISVQHFGFSDALEAHPIRIMEGITRGLLPITTPAYFFPDLFQNILRSTLTPEEAIQVTLVLKYLFIPTLFLFSLLIIYFLSQKKMASVCELAALLGVFIILPPFQAFLIYFCFLHSIRHTLTVKQETGKSTASLMYEAFLPTLFSAAWLVGLYYFLREKETDVNTMYYLFFMGIAALTLPHMILVEGLNALKNAYGSDAERRSL